MLESHYGGPPAPYKYVEEQPNYDPNDQDIIKECHKTISEEFLAVLYLRNANQKKYGSILQGLNTQQSLHNDQYPKTVIDANNVLSNHKLDNAKSSSRRSGKDRENRSNRNSGMLKPQSHRPAWDLTHSTQASMIQTECLHLNGLREATAILPSTKSQTSNAHYLDCSLFMPLNSIPVL